MSHFAMLQRYRQRVQMAKEMDDVLLSRFMPSSPEAEPSKRYHARPEAPWFPPPEEKIDLTPYLKRRWRLSNRANEAPSSRLTLEDFELKNFERTLKRDSTPASQTSVRSVGSDASAATTQVNTTTETNRSNSSTGTTESDWEDDIRPPSWKLVYYLTVMLLVAVVIIFSNIATLNTPAPVMIYTIPKDLPFAHYSPHIEPKPQRRQATPEPSSWLPWFGGQKARNIKPVTNCGWTATDFNFLAADSRNWAAGLGLPEPEDWSWEFPAAKELINIRRKELLEIWGMDKVPVTGLDEWQHSVILRLIRDMLRDAEDWSRQRVFERELLESSEERLKSMREKYKD